jgi:hypothetical protein
MPVHAGLESPATQLPSGMQHAPKGQVSPGPHSTPSPMNVPPKPVHTAGSSTWQVPPPKQHAPVVEGQGLGLHDPPKVQLPPDAVQSA